MVELTKAEEQMMHYLWKLGEGTVQDVMALMNEEKRPSRTTVSTIIRLLEDKGAVVCRTWIYLLSGVEEGRLFAKASEGCHQAIFRQFILFVGVFLCPRE